MKRTKKSAAITKICANFSSNFDHAILRFYLWIMLLPMEFILQLNLDPLLSITLFLEIQIFKYLESLDVEDFKDLKSGYSIAFVSVLFIYLLVLWLILTPLL